MGTEGDRTRSGLAFAFLDLVERHRPPAILFENVPGLLSSNGGRDFGALLSRLAQLGYWWAYRILDAQHFGVPQRRRRVFVVALHAGAGFRADSAAAVLSVGARCDGHSAAGDEAGEKTSGVLADGATSTRTVQSAFGHHGWTLGAQDADGGYLQVSRTLQAGSRGNDEEAGYGPLVANTVLARQERLNGPDQQDYVVARTINEVGHVGSGKGVRSGSVSLSDLANGLATGGGKPGQGYPAVLIERPTPDAGRVRAADGLAGGMDDRHLFNPYRTLEKDGSVTSGWAERSVVDALHGPTGNKEPLIAGSFAEASDPLLPLGLDSHRYRCCGNGVVAPVSEWIGRRLAAVMG